MSVRVLIVDDHPVVRAGLRAVLEKTGRIDVVADVGSAQESYEAIATASIDVVLMDLRLEDGVDGVAATAQIRRAQNAPRVLILTTFDSDADIFRAVEAGATGYLLKDAQPQDLVRAIEAAQRGEIIFAPRVAERLADREEIPDLTRREIEILERVAAGKSNRVIGEALFISEATVKTHLARAFTKMGVASRTEATSMARRLGLIKN